MHDERDEDLLAIPLNCVSANRSRTTFRFHVDIALVSAMLGEISINILQLEIILEEVILGG